MSYRVTVLTKLTELQQAVLALVRSGEATAEDLAVVAQGLARTLGPLQLRRVRMESGQNARRGEG